ncbi:solute carrier family 25 member 44-like protein [Tanacetum coccineum]
MSLRVAEDDSLIEINLPADINWDMLDKTKFFYLGAALFLGVSSMLYLVVVLKTRQQVLLKDTPCFKMTVSILRHEGFKGFYRGFGTSLMGIIPARALYMGALEITKTGLSAAMAAQLVWTPIDVVSQRLMVQGVRGLYKGFGVSILTYAPSNVVWWASYSMAYRAIYGGVHSYSFNKYGHFGGGSMITVQGLSATIASGLSVLVTMPLDTIKTITQVLEGERSNRKVSVGQTARNLVKEGGFSACYIGLGPRWDSMLISATTMITTYESLKKMSTKNQDFYGFLN